MSVQKTIKFLIEGGYKHIRENQGKMNTPSLRISGKIREVFPELLVATLK